MPIVPLVSVVPAASAALALTLLFVPDEPRAPLVAVDVVEDDAGRRADIVVVAPGPPGGAPTASTTHLTSDPVDGSTRLRTLPIAPDGAALADVVDGVLVTVEDVGAWVPVSAPDGAAVTPTKKGAPPAAPSSSLPVPPSLPVASTRALRLFVPTIVAGRAAPASLHGVGVDGRPRVFAGQAVVVTRARPTLALSVADVEGGKVVEHAFDASVPVVVGSLVDGCVAPVAPGLRVLQRTTHLGVDVVACSGALVVGAGHGVRVGDRPEKDRAARGLVVARRPVVGANVAPAAAGR